MPDGLGFGNENNYFGLMHYNPIITVWMKAHNLRAKNIEFCHDK